MSPELERDIRHYFSQLDPYVRERFKMYCQRIIDLRGLNKWGNPIEEVSIKRLCDGFLLYNEVISSTQIAGHIYSHFVKNVRDWGGFSSTVIIHDTGCPQFDPKREMVKNIYSIPVKELLEILEGKIKSSTILIRKNGVIAFKDYKDAPFYTPDPGGRPSDFLLELINSFGEKPLTAKEVIKRIHDKYEAKGWKYQSVTLQNITSAKRDINKAFRNKSGIDSDLIVGSGGYSFNRRELEIELSND